MDHFIIKPDTNFESLFGDVRDQVEFHIFAQRDVRDFDLMVEK